MTTLTPRMAVLLSEAAYSGEDAVRYVCAEEGWRFERSFEQRDTECYLAHRGKVCAIAFRGTQPDRLRDWVTDLKAHRTEWGGSGKVHTGFLESVQNVIFDLYDPLLDFHNRGFSFGPCGHSKGGGEANITAGLCRLAGYEIDHLITFGCPRVGEAKFARWLEGALAGRILRYVHNNDLVARIPLPSFADVWGLRWIRAAILKSIPFAWLLPAGFRHAGPMQYITSKGLVIPEPPRWDLMKDRLRGRWIAGVHALSDGLRDHSTSHYLRAVA